MSLSELRLFFSLAFREFRQLRSLFLLMVINLSWGLTGYLTLSSLQDSLRELLRDNARTFLSADLAVSLRRTFTDEEKVLVREAVGGAAVEEGGLIEMFSMVTAGQESRLVQVKAVGPNYPLYGSMRLESGEVITSQSAKSIVNEPRVWVYPEILLQLNLKKGDRLELGGKSFLIDAIVADDSTQTFRMASLAPKIYMGLDQLASTSLVQFGSTLSEAMLFRLPGDRDPEALKRNILDRIEDPALRATTALEAGEDSGRMIGYIFDYLGLGALVGLSLSGFGMAALVRSWLSQKIRHYAIYNGLGLSAGGIQAVFLIQLSLISVATAALSLLLAGVGLPVIGGALRDWVPAEMSASLRWSTAGKGLLLIWLGSLALTAPFLRGLRRIPVQRLFNEQAGDSEAVHWRDYLWWIPLLVAFVVLSIQEAQSFRLGGFFVLSLGLSYVALSFLGTLAFRLLGKLGGRWWARQGLLYLARKPVLVSTFLALSMGSLLTSLIPQVRAGLHEEVAGGGRAGNLPSLFMFDIQDHQLEDFKAFTRKHGLEVRNLSPLIRARMLSINGRPYERQELAGGFTTREEEAEARMRNRGVNLSYRRALSEGEEIIAGRPFSSDIRPDSPLELSVEKRYADRLGLGIGDEIIFDVQGVEVPGRIVNLRRVKWTRFEPNFFILIQPGALEAAPKIWLANLPEMNLERKTEAQALLARRFPNVSSIDVERLVDKILELVEKMVFALQLIAALAWISGLLVLLSLLYRQLLLQVWDANLYRLLGARRGELFGIFQTQFSVLVLSSVVFGSALALALAWFIGNRFFDGLFAVDWGALLLTTLLLSAVALLLTFLFSLYLSRRNPAGILQEVRL